MMIGEYGSVLMTTIDHTEDISIGGRTRNDVICEHLCSVRLNKFIPVLPCIFNG
jgi:hypothetical protein